MSVTDSRLDQLEESFVNGNISWVVDQILAMRKIDAVRMAAHLALRLDKINHALSFTNALSRRAR
jgi:hypothetical protein